MNFNWKNLKIRNDADNKDTLYKEDNLFFILFLVEVEKHFVARLGST